MATSQVAGSFSFVSGVNVRSLGESPLVIRTREREGEKETQSNDRGQRKEDSELQIENERVV